MKKLILILSLIGDFLMFAGGKHSCLSKKNYVQDGDLDLNEKLLGGFKENDTFELSRPALSVVTAAIIARGEVGRAVQFEIQVDEVNNQIIQSIEDKQNKRKLDEKFFTLKSFGCKFVPTFFGDLKMSPSGKKIIIIHGSVKHIGAEILEYNPITDSFENDEKYPEIIIKDFSANCKFMKDEKGLLLVRGNEVYSYNFLNAEKTICRKNLDIKKEPVVFSLFSSDGKKMVTSSFLSNDINIWDTSSYDSKKWHKLKKIIGIRLSAAWGDFQCRVFSDFLINRSLGSSAALLVDFNDWKFFNLQEGISEKMATFSINENIGVEVLGDNRGCLGIENAVLHFFDRQSNCSIHSVKIPHNENKKFIKISLPWVGAFNAKGNLLQFRVDKNYSVAKDEKNMLFIYDWIKQHFVLQMPLEDDATISMFNINPNFPNQLVLFLKDKVVTLNLDDY